VIEKIGKDFVAVEVNLSDRGFPREIPALKPWEAAYEKSWRHKFGFATTVLVNPEGTGALGTSGCGHTWEIDTSINYDPAKYLALLGGCLDRLKRVRAILEDKTLSDAERAAKGKALKEEVIRQLSEANRCKKPAKGE
jgi:hypothetical protein